MRCSMSLSLGRLINKAHFLRATASFCFQSCAPLQIGRGVHDRRILAAQLGERRRLIIVRSCWFSKRIHDPTPET